MKDIIIEEVVMIPIVDHIIEIIIKEIIHHTEETLEIGIVDMIIEEVEMIIEVGDQN